MSSERGPGAILRIFPRFSGWWSMEVSSLKHHGWTMRGAEGRARETRLFLRAGKGALKAKSSADGMDAGTCDVGIEIKCLSTRVS